MDGLTSNSIYVATFFYESGNGAETIKGSVKVSARDDEHAKEKAWAWINPLLIKECTSLHLSKDAVKVYEHSASRPSLLDNRLAACR